MAAFNYHQLIRQVPPRTWQYYFQSRKIDLPDDHDWNMPVSNLTEALIVAIEVLDAPRTMIIYAELRRVHALANSRGVDALRNVARPDAAIHEDFPQLSSDAERALWAMVNWPELFETAETAHQVNLRLGKRGWKRLQITPCDTLFREPDDIKALELALAEAFTPRKGAPRACQIDILDRHLDGGMQLGMLIEDDPQRQLEFGEDNRAHWRDTRPPTHLDLVFYPASGVIDLLASGGAKAQQKVLTQFAKHVLKKPIAPQKIKQPMFYLNRLRDGFELFDDSQVDLAAYRVSHIRWSQAKLRAAAAPHCDYSIKPPTDKEAPDVLACLKTHQIDRHLMCHGFNVQEAVVSLYFLPAEIGKAERVLHIELRQSGVSNLRDMEEVDAKMVQALLQAWGIMQSESNAENASTTADTLLIASQE
jgi:hypothetical protein